MRRARATSRRGFTLLETVLALALGSLVLLGAIAVFGVMARTEAGMGRRYERVGEMAAAQFTLRRAMLTFVMAPNDSVERDEDGNRVRETQPARSQSIAGPGEEPTEEDVEALEQDDGEDLPPRDRIILEADPVARAQAQAWGLLRGADANASPQRFEVVLMSAPLPDVLLGPASGWATTSEQMGLTFVSAEQQESDAGGVRGVFELRIDGTREALMDSVGMAGQGWSIESPTPGSGEPVGWTLWWREMTDLEILRLRHGFPLEQDEVRTEEGRARLARAAPLVRGLSVCSWMIFVDRVRTGTYSGIEQRDLPAYLEFEMKTLAGNSSNWMFEVGWIVGEDPTDDDGGGADGTSGEDGEGEGGDGGGNGDGADQLAGEGAGGRGSRNGEGRGNDREDLLNRARDLLASETGAPVDGSGPGPGGNGTGGDGTDARRLRRAVIRLGEGNGDG